MRSKSVVLAFLAIATFVAQPRAVLWREVAGLTRAFVQVETQGFDMLD